MSTPDTPTTVPETPIFDPFPETNTLPAGWDLSGLTADPQPAPVAPTDDAAEV